MSRIVLVAVLLTVCVDPVTSRITPAVLAQGQPNRTPSARLIAAPAVEFPSLADSNSPAVWDRINGRLTLVVFTSEAGTTIRHEGPDLTRLRRTGDVHIEDHPGYGVWFEAIIPDVDGTWYGYYHNEWPAFVCDNLQRTIPRIGAARSRDFGVTWQNLGVVLGSARGSYDCASANEYFVGGVGDFSVVLDHAQQYLYVFFSQYSRRDVVQGVSVARLAWADRDAPAGKASVWVRDQTWLPTRELRLASGIRYLYPAGSPIYRVADAWHDDASVDAFWGPSVHWNTHLQQYVMLLNRARDAAWTQEGIYIAFAASLSETAAWSAPQRLTGSDLWYPQVLGSESGTGTDRLAGEHARLFVGGRSQSVIQFAR